MMDNIEPVTFLVIMAIIVGIWLGIGIRDRRRYRRERNQRRDAVERWEAWADAGACAHVWKDQHGYHVCTRPDEHTGPCLDSMHEVLLR